MSRRQPAAAAAASSEAGPAPDPPVPLLAHPAATAIAELLEHERQLILACQRRGYSWRMIGAAAGVTAQAAQQRAARAKRRAAL